MSRIEGWLYSSGEAGTHNATQQLTIDEGGGAQTVLLPAPAVFSDALTDLAAAANSLGLGNTYSFTWNAATQTVKIEGTGAPAVNFTLAFGGNLHNALGFANSGGYAGATSYTGDRARALGRFDGPSNIKVEGSPIQEGPAVEMKRYRHGRHRAVAWGNHDVFGLHVWVNDDVEADFHASYCHAGRVRYYPTDLTTAYSETNPGGYVDGYVIAGNMLPTLGVAERWKRWAMRVAAAREPPAVAAQADPRVWDPLQYGWSPHYAVTIQGTSPLFSEGVDGGSLGLTAPTGFTEDAGSLVIDDGAAVGQRIERDRGIGVGFPLTFQLLPTTTVKALIKVWSLSSVIQADVTATGTTFTLDDVTGWNNGDFFYIGAERVQIGTVNAGPKTFTGCTRGVNGFAYPHQAGSGATARITDLPRFWRGRLVELYVNPVDPSGFSPGTTLVDDAELLFRGHITAGPDRVGENWQFEAMPLDRVLARPISSGLSGTVVDTEVRVPAVPDWAIVYRIEAHAAGVSQWVEDVITRPFNDDTFGDLISESGVMQRITSSFEDAITALGAPTTTRLETIRWRLIDEYSGGNITGASWGAWQAGLALDTNAAIDIVHMIALVGESLVEEFFQTPGGTVTTNTMWAQWYYHATPAINSVVSRPKDRATVKLDDADPADAPDTGMVLIGGTLYTYDQKDDGQGFAYLGGLRTIGGEEPSDDLTGKTAEIIRTDDGLLADLIRRQLMVSGEANLRSSTYDPAGYDQTQGYGLDETLIDVTGIGEGVGGLFATKQLTVASGGESMEEGICQLLALSGRALVAKSVQRDESDALDPLWANRISLVHTAPSGGTWAAELVDADVLASESNPIEVRRLGDPPTRIKVQGRQAGVDIAPIIIKDLGREQAMEPAELVFNVPMIKRAPFVALAGNWAKARFASDSSGREVDVLTVPWLHAEIGDLVKVTLTHHSLVDLVTGAAGSFVGVARVLGSSIQLDSGLRRWTLLFGGYLESLTLCPSAEVQAFSTDPAAPGANDTIDIPIKYLKHFERLLAEDGTFDLTQYDPGSTELPADPNGYEFDGVAEVAGPLCRLTIRTVRGAPGAPTNNLTRLATVKTADASNYQSTHLMHDGDGSFWGGEG